MNGDLGGKYEAYQDNWRDRVVWWLCDKILHLATDQYRALLRATLEAGLHAASIDIYNRDPKKKP